MKLAWLGLIGIGTGLLAVAAPAHAQQASGDNEIEVQGSLSIATTGTQKNDEGSVAVKYGRFFTDYQQVGLDVSTAVSGSFKFGSTIGPFYRYNFSKDKVVPYLGAEVTQSFGTLSSLGTQIQLDGGVRFFVDRRTAFTVSAMSGYSFKQRGLSDTIGLLFGFSHLW